MASRASAASAADPIEFEIVQEAMISIVREMRVDPVATASSPIVCEACDSSCAPIDGRRDRGASGSRRTPALRRRPRAARPAENPAAGPASPARGKGSVKPAAGPEPFSMG